MKKLKMTLLLCLLSVLCFAQGELPKLTPSGAPVSLLKNQPLVVLKAEKKLAIFDPKKDEDFVLNQLKPEIIEAVDVLNGDNATKAYGDNGRNGVIIITIKQFNLVPKELQGKFTDAEL